MDCDDAECTLQPAVEETPCEHRVQSYLYSTFLFGFVFFKI